MHFGGRKTCAQLFECPAGRSQSGHRCKHGVYVWLQAFAILAPPGSSWFPLVPPGSSWLLLALPGSSWLLLLLVSPGSSWLLLAPCGSTWLLGKLSLLL